MSLLGIPENYVYVHYKNGNKENVANYGSLSIAQAMKFKERFETARAVKVVRVTLENRDSTVIKDYEF